MLPRTWLRITCRKSRLRISRGTEKLFKARASTLPRGFFPLGLVLAVVLPLAASCVIPPISRPAGPGYTPSNSNTSTLAGAGYPGAATQFASGAAANQASPRLYGRRRFDASVAAVAEAALRLAQEQGFQTCLVFDPSDAPAIGPAESATLDAASLNPARTHQIPNFRLLLVRNAYGGTTGALDLSGMFPPGAFLPEYKFAYPTFPFAMIAKASFAREFMDALERQFGGGRRRYGQAGGYQEPGAEGTEVEVPHIATPAAPNPSVVPPPVAAKPLNAEAPVPIDLTK